MTTAKKIAVLATVLAVLTVPTLMQWRTAQELRQENEALRTEKRQLLRERHELAERVKDNDALVAQLQRDTAQLPALRGEVASLRQDSRASTGLTPSSQAAFDPSNEASRRANPMTRMDRGRELRKQGNHAEALKEYLWCFDEGSRDPGFAGVRVSFLLSEIADLAKEFPAAREALLSRRDVAEAAVLAGGASASTVFELASLNTHLGEQEKNLALFDQVPTDSPIRGNLVKAASQQFLAARRYQDVVEADDPESAFFRSLSLLMARGDKSKDNPALAGVPDMHTQMLLDTGGNGVEALAGAGQTERAKALADKVLAVRAGAETLTRLIQQAERAGNDDVATYLKGKQPSTERP